MSEENVERISVTATIEVDMDSSVATVSVKRVVEESLSKDAHAVQTVMMLVTGAALQKAVTEIYGKADEEDKS